MSFAVLNTAFNPARRIESQMTDRLTAILGLSRAVARDRALALLAEVHINDPERVLHSYPHQLSGGMRQRVLIAAAFAAEPKLIVADEPTGALDSRSGTELLRFLRTAVDELGQTVVMVTHDPTAASYADRVIFLADGHIVAEAHQPTAEEVLDYMKNLGA